MLGMPQIKGLNGPTSMFMLPDKTFKNKKNILYCLCGK